MAGEALSGGGGGGGGRCGRRRKKMVAEGELMKHWRREIRNVRVKE